MAYPLGVHNAIGGDGCSRICQIENGWLCQNIGQACVRNAKCNDGIVTSPEVCDDGNNNSGDGCSADCKKESTCGGHPVT